MHDDPAMAHGNRVELAGEVPAATTGTRETGEEVQVEDWGPREACGHAEE